jgi:hypothetical protein
MGTKSKTPAEGRVDLCVTFGNDGLSVPPVPKTIANEGKVRHFLTRVAPRDEERVARTLVDIARGAAAARDFTFC